MPATPETSLWQGTIRLFFTAGTSARPGSVELLRKAVPIHQVLSENKCRGPRARRVRRDGAVAWSASCAKSKAFPRMLARDGVLFHRHCRNGALPPTGERIIPVRGTTPSMRLEGRSQRGLQCTPAARRLKHRRSAATPALTR